MRILGARIYSKFFGGKINSKQEVYNKCFLKKSWRMRTLGACIFLSFLAGKLKNLTWIKLP